MNFCLCTDVPFRAGKPTRSPHDWLCKFCVTSSGNPYATMASRVMPSRRDQRIENRQPSRRGSRPEWRLWRKSWSSFDKPQKKSEESSQPETDAPSKAAYKMAIKDFGQLQTAGLFPDDHPAIRSLRAELDHVKAVSAESVPFSKRIRAGQNQVAMHESELKTANERVEEAALSIVAAQQSLEQHRAKVEDVEKALQERRNQLEHLHRQAAAEASHGAEATQLEVMFPDGITQHLPQEAKDILKRATNSARQRQRQRKQLHNQPRKGWRSMSSEAWTTRMTLPRKHGSKRALMSCCRPRQGETPKDWQYCGQKWPETSAHQCRRRSRSKGSTADGRPRSPSLQTTGTSGLQSGWHKWGRDTWCCGWSTGWKPADVERKRGSSNAEAGGGFSPAKRHALKTKSESSLATSAGVSVAALKHWGLEWVWPVRSWQSKELQAHQGRLTMAQVPIMGGLEVFSVYFYHTEEWTERNQQLLEALSVEVRRRTGLWIVAGDFNMEAEIFVQFATPKSLPGVLFRPAGPTFRHGASGSML